MNRKFTAWLAILAIALNALWPLLANAAPKDFSGPICSMAGTKSVPSDFDGIPGMPNPGKSFSQHCPLCVGGSDSAIGLVSEPVISFAVRQLDRTLNYAQIQVWASFIHPYSHPRGPPLLPDLI